LHRKKNQSIPENTTLSEHKKYPTKTRMTKPPVTAQDKPNEARSHPSIIFLRPIMTPTFSLLMNSVENLSGEELLNKAHSLQIVLRTKPYNLIHHEGRPSGSSPSNWVS
jgi:hypothetical protein